ncbi:hypothetical protein Glove_117g433 [Diversispora epigaea]|uniref:Uncharacterized protein n=1 Tax=Diversispora epigaea TaxID=1348612 RepID=A0A397J320_9GLOM|nr:hypothetical protein Glove_117g433 [Diversispora epigaea]
MSFANYLGLSPITTTTKKPKKPSMASTILVKPINDISFAFYLGLTSSSTTTMIKKTKKKAMVSVPFENYLGLSETMTKTSKKIRMPRTTMGTPFRNYLGLSSSSSSFSFKDDDDMKNDNTNNINNNIDNNKIILEEIPIPNKSSIAIKRNLQNFDEIFYKLRMLCKKLNSERPPSSPSSPTILQKLEDMHSRCATMKKILNSHK